MPLARPDRRPLGVVYTPPEIARPMVQLALEPLIRGKTAAELLDLRVCDPAIGEGAFLIEAADLMTEYLVAAQRTGEPRPATPRGATPRNVSAGRGMDFTAGAEPADEAQRAKRLVAASCLWGVDVDAAAVHAASTRLEIGRARLRVTDALELDWAAAYPDVFARGGFDVVVGNPPYIRQERLARTRRRGKTSLEAYASYDGTADLYVYFLELAHRLLRPGGRYCLIVPNKWMTAAYGRRLRGFLAAERSVDGLVDLSHVATFADADAFPCVVWGTVGRTTQAPPQAPIRALRAEDGMTAAAALALAAGAGGRGETFVSSSPDRTHTSGPSIQTGTAAAPRGRRAASSAAFELGDRTQVDPIDHPRDRWGEAPWHVETPTERALLDRLEARWPTLEEVIGERPARGVVTGLNRAFVIDRATRAQLIARDPGAAALIRPFLKGRDVRRWIPSDAERWVLLVDRGTDLTELAGVAAHLAPFREALEPRPLGWTRPWPGRKPGTYAWYELQDPVGPLIKRRAPRLLYQDIQTTPTCSFDREGERVPDTTIWMLPTADRVVLAVLNSPLYGWYARHRFPPALNGAVRPKLEYMRRLPIAQPTPAARREIEHLVDRRLELAETLRMSSSTADPCDAVAVRAAADRAEALDQALARAIDDVYELTTGERALVSGR